jgi:hypothetical protein
MRAGAGLGPHGEWQSLASTYSWDRAVCAGHNTGMLKIFSHCLFQPLSRSNNSLVTMSGISKKQAKKSIEGTGLGECARHMWSFRQPHVSHCLSGKLTGNPRGGEPGRQMLRLWEAEAMAMPGFPDKLSKPDRATLKASYISRYATIGETVTENQANDAVKNLKNTFLKKNKVHRDALPFLHALRLTRIHQKATKERIDSMSPTKRLAHEQAQKARKKVILRHFACFLPVSIMSGQHGAARQKRTQEGTRGNSTQV